MISLSDVSLSFGSFTLLDGIGFHISENDRIGLVGKNGAGKSTLMKLICGLETPTSGRIDRPAGVRIGYLPQLMEHHRGRTVLEEAMTVFEEIRELEREMDRINAELAERTDYDTPGYAALLDRLNAVSDRLALETGESPEAQAERTLIGLGFRDEDFNRPTETFSQGWNMRIELAKILLSRPDVLLLDEPTNHLDIESIEWFEDYLKRQFRGALLLVSHDRRFLDNVTTRTVEILLGKIHDYKVPYSQYVSLRAERMAQQVAAYENQQRMIEKTEDFINRFRYKPTKSNQVQSRIKALEKLERIEVEAEDRSAMSVKFPPAPRSGDVAYSARDLTVGYPQKVVFRHADIEIRRGEKVALIGRNGEGKTTLMRVITGELEPMEGESRLGHNVSVGYFAQNQEDVLDPKETVLSTLESIATVDTRSRLRDILAAFLFKGEDIEKRVSVLSGGERARLGMAKLMLRSCNLLALDEPTNHMDIRSKDILKQALRAYDGTLVVVSHDRDFLDGLVDKLYEFRDGKVREQLGTVSDFLERRKIETLQELERRFGAQPSGKSEEKLRLQEAFEQKKADTKEQRRLRNRVERLETEISALEQQLSDCETALGQTTDHAEVMRLSGEYLQIKDALEGKTAEWERAMEEMEKNQ